MPKAENIIKGSYRNIVDAYHSASPASHAEGELWYTEAHEIAKQISTLLGSDDVRIGAGILSALSPQMEWGDNVSEAILFCSTGYSKRQTQANNDKAILIASGENPEEILGGEKVLAFYHAILNPAGQGNAVIDRHAMKVYAGTKAVSKKDLSRVFGNKRVMRRMQYAYKRAGRELGVHHHIVQSTTWIQYRKDKGIVKETAWSQ